MGDLNRSLRGSTLMRKTMRYMDEPRELVAALLRITAALTAVVLIAHAVVCYNRAQLAVKPYVVGFVWP